MDSEFDITKRFGKDIARLPKEDERKIAASIDKYAATLDTSQAAHNQRIYQPKGLLVPRGFDSSIYVLRATQKLRVILTIEDDPLFGRKLITLLRVVKHDELERALASIAESLYQHLRSEG
ncbi:hypothetical protein [Variovorax boronicumulans]|uniref:hypothetical protein n=1 Tax=Variovorax boronicumulans TaxID=436515 RepID=UPI00277EC699|nr:hypothetical protein [Variovorax boronicumulans]MDQ0042811.1 mRNA-degrading endonuclease RelE of RelBE toxin-antitoxin system [Variovorax boronicumulans]